jgi:hypothetical protein
LTNTHIGWSQGQAEGSLPSPGSIDSNSRRLFVKENKKSIITLAGAMTPAVQSPPVPPLTETQVNLSLPDLSWSLEDLLATIKRVGVTGTISGRLVERQREDLSWYLKLTIPVVAQEGEVMLSALVSNRAMSPEWECGSGGEEWE